MTGTATVLPAHTLDEEAPIAKVGPHAAVRVTALSLLLTAGSAARASLRDLPTEVVCDLIEDSVAAEEGRSQRVKLLNLLATDSRAEVRAQVAQAMGSLWPEPDEGVVEQLRGLSRDQADSVRLSAAAGLARAIERATAPERIDLVCTWALADSAEERLALARALTWSTPVFVADLVLEQLTADESAAVRAAALAAAARHFHEDSKSYARIVSQCQIDPDPSVQRLARALLQRVQA